MAAVISLVVVVTLGLLITRIATVALTMTGMTLQHARFQARSAFTGTGFTTSAAEAVVGHPARRRIVMVLMLVSGAGAVSVLGTLILSFAGVDSTGGGLQRAAVIVVSLGTLLWLARNRVVDRGPPAGHRTDAAPVHRPGRPRLRRPAPPAGPVAGGPAAGRGRRLDRLPAAGRLRLPEEGVAVLGVERDDDTWIGAPSEDLHLRPGDIVVLYGREAMLEDIAARLHGEEGEAASERARAWHAATPPSERLPRP
ncbi:TrkA C-terminal domain-containing protein [Blastococcus sp. PRF04-17]|uniref:TrkA C-terminal domain-containing protein n=1 Tax=Blastococcus sp. PRF04-17 TaxID=2933797 RepID=UPI001FF391CD|nr:TrkA C-terminal domain-containing protein [Blastococcus sp. PRF04-17]UOY03555.1 TrkA C-terminal domain-containing protein [Blastococcus sp. PRF04-17]